MSLKGLVELDEKIDNGTYRNPELNEQPTEVYSTGYSAMQEMESMKNGATINEEVLKNSKLPKEILESFIEKPNNADDQLVYKAIGGSSVDALSQKDGWSNRVREINSKVGNMGKKPIREDSSPYTESASGVLSDYAQQVSYPNSSDTVTSLLLQVLDRLHKIEEKVEEVGIIGSHTPELKVFQLTEGGDLMFLDSDGSVYKAVLEYKGKKKRRNEE